MKQLESEVRYGKDTAEVMGVQTLVKEGEKNDIKTDMSPIKPKVGMKQDSMLWWKIQYNR